MSCARQPISVVFNCPMVPLTLLVAWLESEESMKTSQSNSEQHPFPEKAPFESGARFRTSHERLGMRVRGKSESVFLSGGPAMWLRLMPSYDPGRTWPTQYLQPRLPDLAKALLLMIGHGTGIPKSDAIDEIQDKDGAGCYPIIETGERTTPTIAYVFETAEVWLVNTLLTWQSADMFTFTTHQFTDSLEKCRLFLDNLGCARPYQWVVGLDGVKDRQLRFPALPNRRYQPFGKPLGDRIDGRGFYKDGDSAAGLLRPFFNEVYDQCGVPTALRDAVATN